MLNANWLTSYVNHTANVITTSAAIDISRPQILAILDGLRGSVWDVIRGDKVTFLISLLVAVYCTKLMGVGLVQYAYQLLLKVRYRTNQ